jgi:hypothetical protein
MKNILFLLALVMAISGSSANGMSKSTSPIGISVRKSGNIIKLYYRGNNPGTVKIGIHNSKGEIVFAETLRNVESFMRPYNFSPLPEGDYTIELADGQGKYFQKVDYSISAPPQMTRIARIKKIDNKYLLTVPNQGADALTIKIFNASNSLVYQNTEVINGNFAKLYNVKNNQGAFTFEISDRKGQTNRLTE